MHRRNEQAQRQHLNHTSSENAEPRGTVLDAARKLKEHTLPSERNQTLCDLLNTWGLAEGLQALAKVYGEYYADLAKYIELPEGQPALPGDTIITYYQALTGGGIENVQIRLIEIWKQLGYHVVIVLEEEPNKEVAERLDTPIYLIPSASAAHYAERAIALEEILSKTGARAVVYHKWLCRVFLWDLLLLKSHGLSVICHTHGVFSHSIHNGDLLFSHLAPAYSLCDALVTLDAADCFFWSHFNNHVYETLNPTILELADMKPSINPKKHNILWLARISPEKGVEEALLIFKEVLKRVPDATLDLVGTAANDEYQQSIEQLVRSLEIENQVNMPGWADDQEPYYRNADVFLLTSSDEGFALTLAESRYYGVPCVMFDLPNLTLRGEHLGIESVPQGNIPAAANTLANLLLDEKRNSTYRTLSQDGYRSLYENFDFPALWRDIFLKIDRPQSYSVATRNELFQSLYQTASFHYTCGIQSKNKQIHLLEDRAETAENAVLELRDEVRCLADEEQRLTDKVQRLARVKQEKNSKIILLRKKLKAERKARSHMRNSVSWKIGRAITLIPRKIKSLLSR